MKARQEQSYDIPLHDIKPIVDVNEYSFYYFLGLTFVIVLLLLAISYLIYKWLKHRNAYNIKKDHYQLINSLDINDTKNCAYAITTYGATFKDDSPRHEEMYNNLTQRLEVYKYKKEVDAFDSETIGYIELYKGMLDV